MIANRRFPAKAWPALLLYMANDWNITIINPKGSAPAQQTLDRMKFVTITHATFATATSLQHRREILNIAIEEGRTRARVESRETTDGTINGRHVVDVERSTDTFELRENVMLWTKSSARRMMGAVVEPKNRR